MLYYRYRPLNALTIKELMYNELYFSYSDELNDPEDGKIIYEFTKDENQWAKLLDKAWEKENINTIPIAKYLAEKSPVSVEIFANDDLLILESIVMTNPKIDSYLAKSLTLTLKKFISVHIPSGESTVSFSKTGKNPLMWSHYANKHEGYCLILRAFEGSINPNKNSPYNRRNKMVNTHPIRFEDVNYNTISKKINGFTLFSKPIYGKSFNKEEYSAYWHKHDLITRTKGGLWSYELESRLTLPPHPHRNYKYCVTERIYTYNKTHIAGVIFGVRTDSKNKSILKNILLDKSSERANLECSIDYPHDIVVFESTFDNNEHSMRISPIEIYDGISVITKHHNNFTNKFEKWKA